VGFLGQLYSAISPQLSQISLAALLRNAFSIAMTCYRAVKMAHGNRYLKPFLLVFNTILDGIPAPQVS
jgi:hypothetical protein